MPTKRGTKTTARKSKEPAKKSQLQHEPNGITDSARMEGFIPQPTALPPLRKHKEIYHQPLLLDNPSTSTALLSWFDNAFTTRQMPWRKPWINPQTLSAQGMTEAEISTTLAKRAYEIWVSEIMLQQTRVSTVISYYNSWISQWPTIQSLSEANHDDVLAAWKGLGYYSRATRLWEGAKMIMSAHGGAMPNDVEGLLKVPGIGPYTAGAIASIAFGKPTPLVDGNVARVVSRQVGLYADMKEKRVDKMVWKVAGELVERVALTAGAGDKGTSDVSGRWNQGLMELGSTICTPRPKCGECPIRETCRAYMEGEVLARVQKRPEAKDGVGDIEDACTLCLPLETEAVEAAAEGEADPNANEEEDADDDSTVRKRAASTKLESKMSKARKTSKGPDPKQRSLTDFAFRPANGTRIAEKRVEEKVGADDDEDLGAITAYCSLFPKKAIKKKVPEQECVVCIIESKGEPHRYLISRRPNKGLLAGLWEFPTMTLPGTNDSTQAHRRITAVDHVSVLLQDTGVSWMGEVNFERDLGEITHVFSHLKLKMFVMRFSVRRNETKTLEMRSDKHQWVTKEEVAKATLGTGMTRCWDLMKA